jgi:hypothetical protein
MKYYTYLLLTLALLLVACGGSADPEVQEPLATEALPAEVIDPTPTLSAGATLPPPVIVDPDTSAPVEPTAAAGGGGGEVAAPEPTAVLGGPLPAWPAASFGYGIQSHAVVGDPAHSMEAVANQLGMNWVKIQVEWDIVEPDPAYYQWFFYDGPIDEANRRGLYVMVSVVGAPEWTRAAGGHNGPPDDYNLFAGFMTELVRRYQGKVNAIEVWNEQNLDREWTATAGIRPADYVDFLSRAYNAIKAVDPNVIVISGALSPTGVNNAQVMDDFVYLDQALAAGLLNYADCVGAHHNGYNIGPDVTAEQAPSTAEAATAIFRGPFSNVNHSWSFKTTLDIYAQKVQAIDPNKRLCVTEFGWASSEGYDTFPTNFEFAQDNTLAEQAQFIVQAFQLMRDSGDVWLAFLFNFDFGNKGNGPTDDPVPYSILDTNGVPRPAFDALAAMPKP